MKRKTMYPRSVGIRSAVLVGAVVAVAGGLTAWKYTALQATEFGAEQGEPAEVVAAAVAAAREHRGGATSIGTVLATRSVTLRNELPGTVREVRLRPGEVVEPGAVLVALDVSVEAAELDAHQAQAELAERTLERLQRMYEQRAVSAMELDAARAERDVAYAQIARTRAVIARKTIRAPFRARVGLADVHPGQFLEAGTLLTTLQGVEDAVHVDFSVAQNVGDALRVGDEVEVVPGDGSDVAVPARIVAVDARIDPSTRNARVRVRVERGGGVLTPGGSVRVRVPVGESRGAVAVPVDALRRDPAGDHVFVLETAEGGETRARVRPVVAGPVVGDELLVLGGLEAGERVASTGSFKLYEGALVYVAAGEVAAAAGR
jgi:membrane fusion protein, multidrug efflux system